MRGRQYQLAEWWSNLLAAIKSGWYAFIVPGIIFYGIFSGSLTPTEAGATAVVVTIMIGFIIGTLKLSDFPQMLISSAKVNGVFCRSSRFRCRLRRCSPSSGCRRDLFMR